MLYGEISALCNKEGYCWAGNEYFANLYQTNEKTIRNWIGALRDAGHITVSFTYVSGKKEIESRILKLAETETAKKTHNSQKNTKQPDSDQEVGKIFSIGGEKICHTYGKNLPEVGKISSVGGEKICRDNITSINTTTTTAPNPPESHAQPPPDAPETAVAAVTFSQTELKQALSAIDPGLILTADFYPRAAAFMAANGLDLKYLSWMYEQCCLQKPYSLRGLYFTLFFEDTKLEIYKATASPAPPCPPHPVSCPACGAEYAPSDENCPSCALPQNALPETIELYKRLHVFTPEKKGEYLERENALYTECGFDFDKLNPKLAALHQEFGIPS